MWNFQSVAKDLAICPLCEREHAAGHGWAFCPRDRRGHPDPDRAALEESWASLRSVQEREEAVWEAAWEWAQPWEGFSDFPVFEAARRVLPTVMARLLDARADPNLRAPRRRCGEPDLQIDDMKTPLHKVLAKLGYKQRYDTQSGIRRFVAAVPDCVKLLVRYKADLSLVDVWGRTPLQVALQHRRAGVHFAQMLNAETLQPHAEMLTAGHCSRMLKWIEECVEIMGGEAMATMPSRDTEAARDLSHPWCEYCMQSLSPQECDACHWKQYVVWCAQCDAWRPVAAESGPADKTCPECLVLARPSRHFCQKCCNLHGCCQCSTEDAEQPKTVRKTFDTRRYPTCHNSNCGKQRSEEEGPWNQGSKVHYYCSDACRYPRCIGHGQNTCAAQRPLRHKVCLRYDQEPHWRCPACEELANGLVCEAGECGETKPQPLDAFDPQQVKNWRKGNCKLKCKVCQRGEEYCSRCKARFPKTHFHKKDLDNAQQRRKKNPGKPVNLQCRQ
jgi:hypothetical protein